MPNLSLVAPPQTSLEMVQLSYLTWLESQENERYAKYDMFRRYYEGDHDTQLTARMRAFLELESSQEFSLNHCPIVVDSLAEKLKVTGFECEDNPEIFWEWWRRSRMDAVQAVVHLAAVRDGDSYLLGEWSNEYQRPYLTQENAYDGTQGVHVVYSDERRNVPMVAIKRWIVTAGMNVKTRRTNLYYPDRIEKYTDGGTGQAWMKYEEEGQPWPIPWTSKGQPLGIPVIHFRNKDQGYSYGEIELEDVVPVQNGLNKSFIDLLAAADTTGFRIFTMTGGNPGSMALAPGMWAWHTDPNASIGALPAADLTGLIALNDSIAAYIAKITRTPLSYFQLSGQVAAEGTLKEQESGLRQQGARPADGVRQQLGRRDVPVPQTAQRLRPRRPGRRGRDIDALGGPGKPQRARAPGDAEAEARDARDPAEDAVGRGRLRRAADRGHGGGGVRGEGVRRGVARHGAPRAAATVRPGAGRSAGGLSGRAGRCHRPARLQRGLDPRGSSPAGRDGAALGAGGA